jgi:hypothetical protein
MTTRLPLATIKRILPLMLNVLVTGILLIILELSIDYSLSPNIADIQSLMLKILVMGVLNSCALISVYYLTKGMRRWALWMVLIGGLLLGINILFAVFAPSSLDALGMFVQRYFILLGAYMTFLVVLPIWNLRKTAEAWYLLSRIFIVGLFTILVTGILQIGLTAALAALTTLFAIEIAAHTWIVLAIMVMYMFSQILFWLLMPANVEEGLSMSNYPKMLLRLSQFGLLPLATVYMIILYVYSALILVTGVLPSNQIVYMVVGFLVPNLFALIFTLPLIRERMWIRIVTIIYSALSLPLVGLLFYGIVIRVNDVGLSIDRGLVILLGVWFAFVYVYLLVRKWVKPQIILLSLPVLLVVASFLPLVNIFSLAETSQANRLVTILDKQGYIENNKLVARSTLVEYEYYAEVLDITRYLNANFGLGKIKYLFVDLPEEKGFKFDSNNVVNDAFGLMDYYIKTSAPYYGGGNEDNDLTRSYYEYDQNSLNVKGYNDLLQISYYGGGYSEELYYGTIDTQDIEQVTFDEENFELVVIFKDTTEVRVSLQDFADMNEDVLFAFGSTYDADMTFELADDGYKVMVAFTELSVGVNQAEQITSVRSFSAKLLAAAPE